MSALLDQLRQAFECPIDFEGQRKAERYSCWILITSAVVAFFVGLALQNLFYTLTIYGAGFLTTLVVACPPWPMYNQQKIKWLPVQPSTGIDSQTVAESRKKR